MNRQTFKAIVRWIPNARKSGIPFKNNKYAPLIEIDGKKEFEGNAWSVICYSFEFIDSNTTMALIRFLNEDSAPDILFEGTECILYEGNKKVAYCKITNIVY